MKGIKDLYEIKMVLEGEAAKFAAARIDLDQLEYFKEKFISLSKIGDINCKKYLILSSWVGSFILILGEQKNLLTNI